MRRVFWAAALLGLGVLAPGRAGATFLSFTSTNGHFDAVYYYSTGAGNTAEAGPGSLPLDFPSSVVNDQLGHALATVQGNTYAVSGDAAASLVTEFTVDSTGTPANDTGYLYLRSSASFIIDPRSLQPIQYVAYGDYNVSGHIAVGDTVFITVGSRYAVDAGSGPNPYGILSDRGTFGPGDFHAEYAAAPSPIAPGSLYSANIDITLTVYRTTAEVPGDRTTIVFDPGIGIRSASAVVPEPASIALLGVGGLALLGYGWRRRPRG